MALDKRFYGDPALHVRFEREKVPCYGCKFAAELLGKRYCAKGKPMKKCTHYKEVE